MERTGMNGKYVSKCTLLPYLTIVGCLYVLVKFKTCIPTQLHFQENTLVFTYIFI